MKAFVGIFIALAAIATSSFVAASADPNYVAPAPPAPVATFKLGTLLQNCITALVQQIVKFVSSQITALVSGSTAGKIMRFVCAEIIQS